VIAGTTSAVRVSGKIWAALSSVNMQDDPDVKDYFRL
jgi:hypothetical protein